jgi:hypothetical protein
MAKHSSTTLSTLLLIEQSTFNFINFISSSSYRSAVSFVFYSIYYTPLVLLFLHDLFLLFLSAYANDCRSGQHLLIHPSDQNANIYKKNPGT